MSYALISDYYKAETTTTRKNAVRPTVHFLGTPATFFNDLLALYLGG